MSHSTGQAGPFLSTTDPDGWVGQRVQVASGRHAGQHGTVVSSGNGWVQIETSTGEVAKRAYELQLVTASTSQGDGHDGSRSHKRQRTSKNSSGRADDSSVGGDARGRLFLDTGGGLSREDSSSLLLNLSGGNSSSFQHLRKRPRSYSDSLMTLSPSLLGNGHSHNFFTFRNAYSSVPSATSSSSLGVSGLLSSLPNDDDSDVFSLQNQSYLHSQRAALGGPSVFSAVGLAANHVPRAPIKSAAVLEAKKSYIAKYVVRHSQKIANRPNLADWKQQLDATLVTDALFERQAARAFEESHCEVCSLDKWAGAKFCWNEACPISPIYFKLTGATKVTNNAAEGSAMDVEVPDEEMSVISNGSARRPPLPSQSPKVPLTPARTAIQLAPNGPVSNQANAFTLHLPARIIGTPGVRGGIDSSFSNAQAVLPPRRASSKALTNLVRDNGFLLDLAPVRKETAWPGVMGIAQPLARSDSFNAYASARGQGQGQAPSVVHGGIAGNAEVQMYTQYYHDKSSRSDSFAGETDTEVPSSPLTVP